jgi:protein-disulfide isomerase
MTDQTPPDFAPAPPEIAAAEPGLAMPDTQPGTPTEIPVPPEIEAAEPVSPEHPWPSDAPAVEAGADSGRRRGAALGLVAALALGVVIGVAGFAISTGAVGGAGASPTPLPTEVPTDVPTEEPGDPAAVAPVGNTFGRPDAPVTIEVWADYQCPFCRLEDLLFGGAIDREYVAPGIARVTYRDFAFLGQESIDAAVASRCAGAQDPAAQLRYHDAIYTFQQGENQGRFARANLLQIAEIAGVPSIDAFTACLDDPAVAKAVEDETTAGRNVGITSTPTLRLRGPGGERVVTGFSQTWPPLQEAIEAVRVASPASPSPAGSSSPSPSASPTPAP